MPLPQRVPGRLRAVFWLDVSLLVAVCALETVPFTGLVIHEWLGLALAALLTVHLLLSWAWIASTTGRLMAAQDARTRVNYFLNLTLFACMTAVIFSGVLISQEAIPALTMRRAAGLEADARWTFVHDRLSDVVLILGGLHLAINWTWSAAAARAIWGRR